MQWTLASALAGLLSVASSAAFAGPPGVIDRFEIVSQQDAYNGATPPGATGPYVVITGIVHGKLDPKHPDNGDIADLSLAPRDANGWVAYSTDAVILRPKSAANARRIMFYDVVNRGGKAGQGTFIGGGSMVGGSVPDAKFPSLLSKGYTIVWSGWQGEIGQTGQGATNNIGTDFPVAKASDGSALTGMNREEFIPDYAGGSNVNLSYLPASMTDRSEVVFTARQTWHNSANQQDYAARSTPVTSWNYVTNSNGTVSVQFTAPSQVAGPNNTMVPPDAGTIYSFVYRAKEPKVMAIGFAAVRDLVSFLRSSNTDAQGNANPLNDMKSAQCAKGTNCPVNPSTNYDTVLGEGTSQSGRFMRNFLYRGYNKAGDGKKVFDGVMVIIAGGRRTWTAVRFAQQGRWSKSHEDHFMQGDQFPFAYNTLLDPVSGRTDGIMKRCDESKTCPKLMQIDGSFEWWGGRGSLVVTDGAGKDLKLPKKVRYYLVPGTQHGGGGGVTSGLVTQPGAGSTCLYANSPVMMTPVERGLLQRLESWVVNDIAPPPSRYPKKTNLKTPDKAALGFPDMANIMVPNGSNATPIQVNVPDVGRINQVFVTDYLDSVPIVSLSKQYKQLVADVNGDGNEAGGVMVPELAAPLGTYTGWNVRGSGHAAGESCGSSGTVIPFAVDWAKKSPQDQRQPLSSRYTGRADYANQYKRAADTLVSEGFITRLDADNIYYPNATQVSPLLIPNP